jgi:hypothetical protein
MPRLTTTLVCAAALALLAAEWSGMHTHVGAGGFHGAAQGMHDHHHGHEDDTGSGMPDHDDELDMRVVDYGLSASKILVFVAALGVALFLLPPSRGGAPITFVPPLTQHRRTRWRPPLRGPPLVRTAH